MSSEHWQIPRIDAALFVGLLLETFLIGIFYILLVQTFLALRFRAKTRGGHFFRPITICALVLLGTITARWIADISRTFYAFIQPDQPYCIHAGQANPAEMAFSKVSDPNFVTSTAMYWLSIVLGDGFMIYRLWIVWGKNKLIIIPPMLFLGAIATTAIVFAYRFQKYGIFVNNDPWIICSYVFTFLCNLYSTALIALKILLSGRELPKPRMGLDLSQIVEILVQSAALYSCCIIISMATYLSGSNVHAVMLSMNSPMIGVIFCMIVIRTHQVAAKSPCMSDFSFQRSGGRNTMPMRPLTIKVANESQMDGNYLKHTSSDRTSPPSLECHRSSKMLRSPGLLLRVPSPAAVMPPF